MQTVNVNGTLRTAGRFGGVDAYAHKQFALSTYQQSANNPVMFIDPDGRWIKLVFLVAKAVIKKVGATKAAKAVGVAGKAVGKASAKVANKTWNALAFKNTSAAGISKSISAYAGGTLNMVNNWEKIQKNPLKAFGYFLGGAVGSTVVGSHGAEGLFASKWAAAGVGFSITGAGNIFTEAGSWDKMNFTDFAKMFAKGGSAALSGAAMGKYYLKGAGGGPMIEWDQTILNTAESFSLNFGKHEGPINIGQMFGYAASGFASSIIGDVTHDRLELLKLGKFGKYSNYFTSGIIGDFSGNIMDYYVKSDYNWAKFKKIQFRDVHSDWGKSGSKGSLKGFFKQFGGFYITIENLRRAFR